MTCWYAMSRCFIINASLTYFSVGFMLGGGAVANDEPNCITGTLRDGRSGRVIQPKTLIKRLRAADFVYVGERHGVVEHPLAAACLFTQHLQRPKALVVEQMRASQQQAINQYRVQHSEDISGLGPHLKWWQSGWPAWSTYEPLLSVTWLSRSPLIAGDRESSASPFASAHLKERYGPTFKQVKAHWSKSMLKAHCGLIKHERAQELAVIQMSRDIAMADAIGSAKAGDIQVWYYAGRAHVRKDHSVPLLMTRLSARNGLSIALYEETAPTAPKGAYDITWHIGQVHTISTCDRLSALKTKAKTR